MYCRKFKILAWLKDIKWVKHLISILNTMLGRCFLKWNTIVGFILIFSDNFPISAVWWIDGLLCNSPVCQDYGDQTRSFLQTVWPVQGHGTFLWREKWQHMCVLPPSAWWNYVQTERPRCGGNSFASFTYSIPWVAILCLTFST